MHELDVASRSGILLGPIIFQACLFSSSPQITADRLTRGLGDFFSCIKLYEKTVGPMVAFSILLGLPIPGVLHARFE